MIFSYPPGHHLQQHHLVGGLQTILKNDGVKVNGKDDIPYEMENNPAAFQTTKRLIMVYSG